MKVLLYIEAGASYDRSIRNMVTTIIPSEHITVFKNYMDMRTELLDPFRRQHTIVIAAVHTTTQLSVLSNEHVLRDYQRMILIIPLQNTKLAETGYKMKPRFIGDIEGSLDSIAGVLKRMAAQVVQDENGDRSLLNKFE